MKEWKIEGDGISLTMTALWMGEDLCLTLSGGDSPHIGTAILALPRKSLKGEGRSATSSVLNCIGHKDELPARKIAETAAALFGCTVVCVCGIHLEDYSEKRQKLLWDLLEKSRDLLEEIYGDVKKA